MNPNMPLRGFFYFAKQYQGIVSRNQNALYSSRFFRIPTPCYIVFYNGESSQPDRRVLRLSDAFLRQDVEGCPECTAEVLNIHFNHNKKLLNACKTLHLYGRLMLLISLKTRLHDYKFPMLFHHSGLFSTHFFLFQLPGLLFAELLFPSVSGYRPHRIHLQK